MPPPETAALMIGAVDAAVVSALSDGVAERFAAETAPELAWIACAAFLDEDEASAARASLAEG